MTTIRDIILDVFGDPPMYDDGYNGLHPVDLNGLDTPIVGYKSVDHQQTYRDAAAATQTFYFDTGEEDGKAS